MTTLTEVAKLRFREFSEHLSDSHAAQVGPTAYRDREHFTTVLHCSVCDAKWNFSDAALRATPHILDYLWWSGLETLVEPVLNFKPIPGAWGKVLLGILEDDDPSLPPGLAAAVPDRP